MTSFCKECYQSNVHCPKANNPGAICRLSIDFSANRRGDGRYNTTIFGGLPNEVNGLSSVHIDTLTGYTPTAPPTTALSTDASDVLADWSTLTHANTYLAVEIFKARPSERDVVEAQLMRINAGATQPQALSLANVFTKLREIRESESQSVKDSKTQEEFKSSTEAYGFLFQTIVKRVVRGLEYSSEEGKQMYDATTGKILVPFDKATKVTSFGQFFYSYQLFVTTVCQMQGVHEGAWLRVMKDLNRRCDSGATPVLLQAYFADILKLLDQKEFQNVIALFTAGEHNHLYEEACIRHKPKKEPNPNLNPKPTVKRYSVGPVTIQGCGLGLIKDRNGKPLPCKNFHASPCVPCTQGATAGDVSAADVGKCLYQH